MLKFGYRFLVSLLMLSQPIAVLANPQASQTPASDNQELTVGHEFEFNRLRMMGMSLGRIPEVIRERAVLPDHRIAREIEAFVARTREKCPECRIETFQGRFTHLGVNYYRVTFPDGYFIEVTPDPWTVEIKGRPQTLSQLRANRDRMQEFIFETAHEVGLKPRGIDNFLSPAAGHMNFGVRSAFGTSGRDFLAFFVDYANHPELAAGVLGHDFINAPPMERLSLKQRSALEDLVKSVNNGDVGSIERIAKIIRRTIYTESPLIGVGAHHNQAFGTKYVEDARASEDRPFEWRAVRMQMNIDEYILLAELVDARIRFIKTQNTRPIIYLNTSQTSFSRSELVSRFYVYITEAGLDYNRYRALLPNNLREVVPDQLVRGEFNWYSYSAQQTIEAHLPYLATSDFLRTRLLSALSDRAAADSGLGIYALRKIAERMRNPMTSIEEQRVISDFLQALARTPTWSNVRRTPYNDILMLESRALFPDDRLNPSAFRGAHGPNTCSQLFAN